MRLLIQSITRGAFLVPDDDNQPTWEKNLRLAGAGVITDIENAFSMIEEYTDFEDCAHIVDLDRLGTIDDYP